MNTVLSIVTVVYNEPEIEKTIISILPFVNDKIEYIVIDGGSNDDTLEVLKKYSDKITKFISESDNGIYDAMNKASKIASGKYILHINAGDTISNIPIIDLENPEFDEYSAISYPVFCDSKLTFLPSFDSKIKFTNSLHHQGTFYKREVVNYNLKYKIFADFDLNQRIYYSNGKVLIKSKPIISTHLDGGLASGGKYRWECYKVIISNSGYIKLFEYFLYRAIFKIKILLKKDFKPSNY